MRVPRTSSWRVLCWLAVAAVLGAVVTACGDSDADTAPVDESLSGKPVKLGIVTDVTSPGNINGPGIKAVAEAWAGHVNGDGGVGGHEVELVVVDSKNDSATAVTAVKELAADPEVVGVMVFDSYLHPIEVEEAKKTSLPVLGGFLSTPGILGTEPDVFGLYPSLPAMFSNIAAAAKDAGLTKALVMECTVAPSCHLPAESLPDPVEAQGMEYLKTLPLNLEAPNFTAPCLEALDQGADFIYVAADPDTANRVMQDCRTQGYEGAFSANVEVVNEAAAKEIPDNFVLGVMLPFPWFADSAPVDEYVNVMEDAGLERKLWADGAATNVYVTLELFRAALDNSAADLPDTVTRDAVLNAYEANANEDLDGALSEPISFNVGEPQPPLNCLFTYEFKDGEFSTLRDGLTPTCSDES